MQSALAHYLWDGGGILIIHLGGKSCQSMDARTTYAIEKFKRAAVDLVVV